MEEERKAEEKGWNERRFFQFNPTPNMPQDAESKICLEMADDPQSQSQQQQAPQQQSGARMPQVNYLMVTQDDYAYEMKPLPKRAFDQIGGTTAGQSSASGGMSSQFDVVSSALNKNI
jgi:hypothetical protein